MNERNSGAEIQRLSALSDGIFSVAMTLLAFNVHLPDSSAGERLSQELARMFGEAGGLVVSFCIAAMFWMSHLRLFGFLQKVDIGFRLLNFALLLSIVVLPISTSLETSFGRSPIASFVLEGNLTLISLANASLWLYALGRLMLALPSPGLRGVWLQLVAVIFPVLVFALSLLIMVWKPTLGPRLSVCAFATPLISHLAGRAFGAN